MNKSRNSNFLVTLILASLVLFACQIPNFIGDAEKITGSGNVVEETREVSGISGVELATLGHLTITVGDTESLIIEAEDNLMEYFVTKVSGGKLTIGTKPNIRLDPKEPVNYYLTVTGLDTIQISSAGDIQAPDLVAGDFSIKISSAGDLNMGDLEAETLTVKINSAGDVTMGMLNADKLEVDIGSTGDLSIAGGTVTTQDITISSTGSYTALELASDAADVRISSAGSVTIWVKDDLKANLSSSGDLHYTGNPTVDSTTNSSGDVIQINE